MYVGSLGESGDAEEVRRYFLRRLRRGAGIEIVQNLNDADAVAKGTAQIWTTSHVFLSPRSHIPGQPTLAGFLSVEIIGKDGQTLWSYLVTPSKFPWNGIADDLAKQLVNRLLADMGEKASPQNQPVFGTVSTARAVLRGAGATFPAPLYRKWFESFEQTHPDIHIDYDTVGSAEGIRGLKDRSVDFGASEMPLSDRDMSSAHLRLIQVPTILGAVVPIYNVQKLHRNISLTPETLAGIYLGKIKKWSDPQIRRSNRGVSLPDAEIVVVHRSDGSGTTFVWSDYLSKVSPEWRNSVGSGVTIAWPVGVEAAYNDGVAAVVQSTPNSIGYVEFIYAIQHELEFASVRNSAGQFIKADIASVRAASESAGQPDTGFRVSITDAPGKDAYPIATYTWFLFPEQSDDINKRKALVELLRWMLSSGQKSCSALGYAPLPADVANRGLQIIDQRK